MLRRCDECGKNAHRIVRNDVGHRYCATCYARCFKHRACGSCGRRSRIRIDRYPALCEDCRWKGPCVRCGREGLELGRRTPFGPACKACSAYYREKSPCSRCGVPSARLVSVVQNGVAAPLCERCQRSEHRTCSQCHRDRPVATMECGRPVCAACAGGATRVCTTCSEPMPAGRVSRCESCYHHDLLRRRAAISACRLSKPEVASAFREYAAWLSAHTGPAKASRLILQHLGFFLEIEKRWAAVPTPEVLLKAFGTARLRRSLLVTRFIAERSGAPLSAARKAEAADAARIERALDGVPSGTPAFAVLSSYRDLLLARNRAGRIKLVSVRLALTAARGLVKASEKSPRSLPDQAAAHAYLRTRPGQRAALAGFLGHLRRHGSGELLLPNKRRSSYVEARSAIESELRKLLTVAHVGRESDQRLLALALQYFHGVPRKTALRFSDTTAVLNADGGGGHIRIKGKRYWLPPEVAARLGVSTAVK